MEAKSRAAIRETIRRFGYASRRPNRSNSTQSWLDILATNEDDIGEFRLLETDKDRFIHAFRRVLDHYTNRGIYLWYQSKTSELSIKLRDRGNTSYSIGLTRIAVQEYTASIIHAVDSSEELAIAYANRSMALFKLEKLHECIEDINRALSLKYPDSLKTKLYTRKALCYMKLGDVSLEEALMWVDKTGLSDDEMNTKRAELKELLSSASTIDEPSKTTVKLPMPEIPTTNFEIPCASDGVAIKYSEKLGRHLVATRRIKPGELLILEKPYSSQLENDNLYTHCSHCLQESWSLIPCKSCVNVAYCSAACKDKAWSEYHEVECPVLRYLADYRFTNPIWISVKTAIIATQKGTNLHFLKEELRTVDSNPDERTKGFSEEGKFISSRYRSVYSMRNNAHKCSTEIIYKGSLCIAFAMCIIARETNMFGERRLPDLGLTLYPDIIFVGELMLKQLLICFSNMLSCGLANGKLSSKYADGVLPFCSLLNHSCDANTLRQWIVDRQAVYALFPIEQGEQIFDCYGVSFQEKTKFARHSILENWKFTCDCPPCVGDWPIFLGMPSYKNQHLSLENKNNLDRIMQKLISMCRSLLQESCDVENLKYVLDELLKAIESLLKLAEKPYRELYLVIRIVQMFYWSGNAIFEYPPNKCVYDLAPSEFYNLLKTLVFGFDDS